MIGKDTIKRIGKRKLYEISGCLSDKDNLILLTVGACRYITSRQIMRLYFQPIAHIKLSASVRNANRHLFRLKELGVIEHLDRRIGGVRAGSGANIWYLTTAGHKLLCLNERVNEGSQSIRDSELAQSLLSCLPRKRHHEPTPRFLEHRLAVTEVFVRLHELTGKSKVVSLDDIALEPECWREHPSIIGGKASILKPDLYLVTTTKGNKKDEYEDYWFMEVDLATESPAVVLWKCEQYIRYFQSGIEQHKNGVFPRVVWIVPTDKRKESLQKYVEENFDGIHLELFSVITMNELPGLVCGNSSIAKTNENAIKNVENATRTGVKKAGNSL